MPMPYVSVVNLGCRVNRVESDRISTDLAKSGFCLVEPDAADLVVINTCAVTGEAEAKTRKAVRHALAMPRGPQVVVTGCVVNLHPEELTQLSDRVHAEAIKTEVPGLVCKLMGHEAPSAEAAEDPFGEPQHDVAALLGRSRLGVKIQDGCNHRCTYCIVWKARGLERSVPVADVLAQVNEAVAAGIPEVVLTGVNLGAYRYSEEDGTTVEIDGLVDRILTATDVPQLRLSSIEPMDVSDALIDRMAASPDRIAPFLHLPVQSGCTQTLHRMGRPYTAEAFCELVDKLRAGLPNIAVSGDLIVGFPGETDEEFERTLAMVERVAFARLHVFRYSARPQTPAAEFPDQVDPQIAARRSAQVRDAVEQSRLRDAAGRIGSIERAVLEYGNRGTLGSFHRIVVDDADARQEGELVRVRIDSLDDAGMLHGRLA